MVPKIFSPLLAAALLIFFALAAPAQATEIDASEYWTVAEVRGDVTARIGGNPWNANEQLVAGQHIGPYSTVEAGNDSEAILVRAGDRMTLYANTEIELPPVDRSTGITRIFQRAGEVLFRIRKRDQRNFEVETPYLVAGVRGTTFGVIATDATSELHVVEGAVAVGGTDDLPETRTIVNALERATAGLGMQTSYNTANEHAAGNWDDRSLKQAEMCDILAVEGPSEVQMALTQLPTVTNGTLMPIMSDMQDITARIANREQVAIDRAIAQPTPHNKTVAEMAKASSIRLASAGIALDSAPMISPTVTTVALPTPMVAAPTLAATPALAPTLAPSLVSPSPMAAITHPSVLAAPTAVPVAPTSAALQPQGSAPRSLLVPRATPLPTNGATIIIPPASGAAPASGTPAEQSAAAESAAKAAAEQTPPNTDGVVYTTFGILPDQDGADTSGAQADTPSMPPGLNIEGMGAGN